MECSHLFGTCLLPNNIVCLATVATSLPLTTSARKSGPVRFFGPKFLDRDRDRSALVLGLKKTGPDRKKTADRGFNRSLDRSQSAPVLTGLRPVF